MLFLFINHYHYNRPPKSSEELTCRKSTLPQPTQFDFWRPFYFPMKGGEPLTFSATGKEEEEIMKNSDRADKQRKKQELDIYNYACKELSSMRAILKHMYLGYEIPDIHGNIKWSESKDENIEFLLQKVSHLRHLMFDCVFDGKSLRQSLEERNPQRDLNKKAA